MCKDCKDESILRKEPVRPRICASELSRRRGLSSKGGCIVQRIPKLSMNPCPDFSLFPCSRPQISTLLLYFVHHQPPVSSPATLVYTPLRPLSRWITRLLSPLSFLPMQLLIQIMFRLVLDDRRSKSGGSSAHTRI